MAERRMIAKTIVDSDVFLDMPQSAQNLYFHFNVRADDEGFVNSPNKIIRMVGANKNDLDILLAKRYVLMFDSGVIVIKHWKLHNAIRKDRLKETVYLEEKQQLLEKDNGAYTTRQPSDNQVTTECLHRLGKVSIEEVSIEEEEKKKEKPFCRFTFIKNFFKDDYTTELDEAIREHMKVRDSKKASKSERAIKDYCSKLKELSNGIIDNMIKIVDNSSNNGWSGLFELKKEDKKEKPIEFDNSKQIKYQQQRLANGNG